MAANNNAEELTLTFECPEQTRISEFELKLLEIDAEHLGAPPVHLLCRAAACWPLFRTPHRPTAPPTALSTQRVPHYEHILTSPRATHSSPTRYGLHNVHIGIPEEEADVNVRMPAKEFERIVKTLVEMGDHMTIAVST